MAYLYLVAGIVLLLFGGDFIVKGAVDLALRFRISILVIGMTVVSFATSAPELLVSLDAALAGYTDISFGNVIGSNIANISLILGLTAMVVPLSVQTKTFRLDWWVMMGVTLLLFLFLYFDHLLGYTEGLIMVILLIAYNVLQIRTSRKSDVHSDIDTSQLRKLWLTLLFLGLGVAGLKFGSEFLIEGAVIVAREWGVSERVIGITVVSVGTSLPELAASLVAAFKGEPDLSVGNLIGSNVFNILAVLGFTGMIIDIPLNNTALMTFDFPWLFGISLLLYPFMRFVTRARISRWEGLVMFIAYLLYIGGVLLF
ncbi:MAG: calcium/sodium antiporter [Owenweeksia sp.]